MELTDAIEGGPLCCDRLAPQIGSHHQVTMPPLKQSARIASLEYINRDQWYACGLAVPIMYIATPPPWRKCRGSADQDKSFSLVSTSNSRTNVVQSAQQQQKIPCAEVVSSKDANSCASSTKETCQAWKKEESSSVSLVDVFQASQSEQKSQATVEDVAGVSGQSELKSSITSVLHGSIVIKKKKKRRSCWQTLKRKGTKKARTERGRKDKRWSESLRSEVGEASGQGSAIGGTLVTIFPGGQPDSWSEDDVAAFTLALYLFDKDFCAIKRFLETKKMKDILHFYYGKFYGTPAFCRWAGSKNSRNRKCVHGPRILQGWRQGELLRRLLPHFPQASKDVIPEAVKSFNERELTVEGLAAKLKAVVGLDVLVHCVGIGVPKRDLTAVHGDPAKHHGKHHLACSSLSKEEMLECLTGDHRISKTRAQDLFWEGVWPRLLAHGWNSKECEIPGLPGSKSSLVFLRPGVTKIAKGSSERGVQYFDSVSELLKEVANDPGLLDDPELTGDTMEGSENQEDDDVQGWSDDMFETLDMHRLRGPRAGKTEAGVKNAQSAFKASSPSEVHVAQDSSESSSVDIDLNRPLSAVNSKPPELPNEEEEDGELRSSPSAQVVVNHHHRCPIEEIDLNLPPIDLDCSSPACSIGDDGEAQLEIQSGCSSPVFVKFSSQISIVEENEEGTGDPNPIAMHAVMAAAVDGGSSGKMGAINLNEPLPTAEMMMVMQEELSTTGKSSVEEQEQFATEKAAVPSVWPVRVELMALDSCSGGKARYRPQLLNKTASCSCGFANPCKCHSKKRSLSCQEDGAAAQEADNGKELISVFKKRAITVELPFRLNGLHTPNFVFSMHLDAVARMNSLFRSGIRYPARAPDWNIRASASVLPFHVQEKFAHTNESGRPTCKLVEVHDDMDPVYTEPDAEDQGNDGDVQRSAPNQAPLTGQYGNVKRLRCHFSETEAPVSSLYSRSKFQRQPRKYTFSIDSKSSKGRLLKPKERCSDWSWPLDRGSVDAVVESISCCSTSHGILSTDFSAQQCGSEQLEVVDDRLQCNKSDVWDRQKQLVGVGKLRESMSGYRSDEERDTEIDQAKSLMRDWKVPCLTLTAPADSFDSYGLPRQMPRSRGFRSNGRSQSLPAKSIDSDSLNFNMGMKRTPIDLQEMTISKKIKVDASYSLRSREMSEQELLITLCSMQEHKVGGIISSEVAPKVKGKRSSRPRRRNFSFKRFIFEGHVDEELEEGLSVQPCTSQGPWQPTCHLPTTEKISRSSKLRRRRSGLPCKGSCVTMATSPIAPGLKGGGSTSKGQLGSRVPSQTVPGLEEATGARYRPAQDVRFSLRRSLSDGSSKTDRQIGRKVPARWNQSPTC